ncbi:MAG: DUF3147 family protein [Deltaproteobacteria bacterium]|jgi:uncharacterized membrane protein (GlpM family)|nr:DUF3147 family protein [Deltaproteobacteria bacterium]
MIKGKVMEFFIKLLISVTIIIICTQIGRKFPSFSGLIATMPIISVIILVWIYSDNPGDFKLMEDFTKAALWGIVPSILFFLVAYFCFINHYHIGIVLSASFGTWLMGAFVHQWLLR